MPYFHVSLCTHTRRSVFLFSHPTKTITLHWGCTYLRWWGRQKSLGKKKKKRLAGSHGDCLLCLPMGSVTALSPFQGIPLTAGALIVDMALPRNVLLSRGANEFLGSRFCSCFVLWHALPSGRSIVLPIKVIYGSQEAGRAPCPHGSLCPCWGWVMSNIAVELWLPQSGYLNSCRLLRKAIHTAHLPPSDHKYLELAAHSQYQIKMDVGSPNQLSHISLKLLLSLWWVHSVLLKDTRPYRYHIPKCLYCWLDLVDFLPLQSHSFLCLLLFFFFLYITLTPWCTTQLTHGSIEFQLIAACHGCKL